MMRVIGLTGGIASGKSTVSKELGTLGAAIIDADAIAIALAEPGMPLWEKYVEHFGRGILQADQTLDRAKIGQIIFHDDGEKAWTNQMSHPIIEKETRRHLADLRHAGIPVAVLDVPLLFEAGWDKMVDEIWVVWVSPDTQLRRLMARNHYTEEAARSRITSQKSLEEKRLRADLVFDNNGTREALLLQVHAAWQKAMEPFRATGKK